MRKISKIASALALSCALALAATAPALADVTYRDQNLAVTGSGEYTATDLFGNFKNVMPGDELDQPVTVSNESGKTVKVYLRAEAHDEASNPPVYAEPASDGVADARAGRETVASMADFLRQLHLTVKAGGVTVFDATPDLEAQLAESVLLGEVAPGAELQVDAHLSVPVEMGDDYANRVGEVDWVFTVEELDEPAAPADKLAGPLSQTGDSSPVLLLAALAGAAVVVAAAALLLSRRSRR